MDITSRKLRLRENRILNALENRPGDRTFRGRLYRDGVPSPEVYLKQRIKVVFVFREPNMPKPRPHVQARTGAWMWRWRRFASPSTFEEGAVGRGAKRDKEDRRNVVGIQQPDAAQGIGSAVASRQTRVSGGDV